MPDTPVRTAGGITAYLGVVPAAVFRAQPGAADHPEAPHHPTGERHVLVALFDDESGERIREARVRAYLAGRSRAATEHVLEPMHLQGATTFGTFMALPAPGPYRLRVEVTRPDAGDPVRFEFRYTPPVGAD